MTQRKIALSIEAVSYTHLDVYKRQYFAYSKIALSVSPISSSTTDSLILCCVLHNVPQGTLV